MAIACPRSLRTTVLAAALSANVWSGSPPLLLAQGVSTGSISGTVRAEDGRSVDGANASVINRAMDDTPDRVGIPTPGLVALPILSSGFPKFEIR